MAAFEADIRPVDPDALSGAPWQTRIEVVLRHRGEEKARIARRAVEAAPLVLEVRDERDRPVHLAPPPVPKDEESEVVGPGWSRRLVYENFLGIRTPPGRYRVRYRGAAEALGGTPDAPLLSPWLELVIKETGASAPPHRSTEDGLLERKEERARGASFLDWLRCRRWRCCRRLVGEFGYTRLQEMSCEPTDDSACTLRADCYGWDALFRLELDLLKCRARLVLRIAWQRADGWKEPDSGPALETWIASRKTDIEARWGNRFRLCFDRLDPCCPRGYPLDVEVAFAPWAEADSLTPWPHLYVTVGNTVTWLDAWDYNDDVLVPHEIGHLIGPCDEYYTVACAASEAEAQGPCSALGAGVAYGLSTMAGQNIMHDAVWGQPAPKHLAWVARAAGALRGSPCRIVPVAQPCRERPGGALG